MTIRLTNWLSAGLLTCGLGAAMLGASGVSIADTDSPSDSGASSSASSSSSASGSKSQTGTGSTTPRDSTTTIGDDKDPTGSDESARDVDDATSRDDKKDVDKKDVDTKDVDKKDVDTKDVDKKDPEAAAPKTVDESDSTTPTDGQDTAPKAADDQDTATTNDPDAAADGAGTRHPLDVAPQAAPETAEPTAPISAPDAPATPLAARQTPAPAAAEVANALVAVEVEEPTTVASVMAAPPQPPAPPTFSLINVIGSLIFGVYDLVLRLFEGPPVLPPNSTVTVRTSTLRFESGREIPANWYFPDDPEPKGLIFLQHGFLAAAPFYSYTAAALAERTNSIVVATSVTSNPFAADGFYLSGAGYQQAVAGLFTGDRNELTDSASAALGQQVTLPTAFVLSGHSAGGGLALAAASHLDDAALADLAGIVLLDGVASDDIAATAFDTLPDSLPIYQLGAPPYSWNRNGATAAALVAARPGAFNGVELVGGSHVDSTQGGNFIFQFASYLVTGFSQPQNIEAVKILAAGWINDMFAGTSTGVYGVPGQAIVVPTDAGPATAIVYPVGAADALTVSEASAVA